MPPAISEYQVPVKPAVSLRPLPEDFRLGWASRDSLLVLLSNRSFWKFLEAEDWDFRRVLQFWRYARLKSINFLFERPMNVSSVGKKIQKLQPPSNYKKTKKCFIETCQRYRQRLEEFDFVVANDLVESINLRIYWILFNLDRHQVKVGLLPRVVPAVQLTQHFMTAQILSAAKCLVV